MARSCLQKDSGNTSKYAIDFVNFEQVSPVSNPDQSKYVVPAGFGHQNVQDALDKVRMDTTGSLVGVYLPTGDYQTIEQVPGVRQGDQGDRRRPWYTRF